MTAELWSCPDCAFTFSAEHTDRDGGYSCPLCGLWAAEGRIEAVRALHRSKTFDGRSDHHHAAAVAALGSIAPYRHDCTDACFETFTFCDHDGLKWPCPTALAVMQ